MTRTRNSDGNQSGTRIYDGDVDAVIFKRVLLELAHDFHAIHDIVTGQNNPSVPPVVTPLSHDGTYGEGSLLGMPIVNQAINKRIGIDEADVAAYGGDSYILGAPVYVPPGETFLVVEVDSPGGPQMTVEVYDAAGALSAEWQMTDLGDGYHQAGVQVGTTGALYYFLVRRTIEAGYFTLGGWRVFVQRQADANISIPAQDGNSIMPVPTASAGVAMNIARLHDEYFQDNFPLPGKVVNDLNRNINALWEALTGAPVDGNQSVTNADSATVNPATSRFIAKTKAGTGLTTEPLVSFPLWCEALGAAGRELGSPRVNNVTPPTLGISSWFAPFPRDTAASTGRKVTIEVPDFPKPTDPNYMPLKATVLGINESTKGVPGNWQARVTSTTGASPSFVSMTRLGSTNFYAATVSDIDFDADDDETFALETIQSPASGFVFGEMQILGWAIYFSL